MQPMGRKVFISLFILSITCLLTLSNQKETDSLTEAKNYKNNTGVQIYMNNNNNVFSYISIDATVTDKLKATLYLYTTIDVTNTSVGFYTSIGFGGSKMSGSDILLCAVENDKSTWCKDYTGSKTDISIKKSITTLTSGSWNNALSTFSPFTYVAIWNIERQMNPSDVINGRNYAIYAFGSLSASGVPAEHNRNYFSSINTGDGNSGTTFIETVSTSTTSTTTTTTASTNTTTNTTNTQTTSTITTPTTTTTTTTTTSITTTPTTTKSSLCNILSTTVYTIIIIILFLIF